MNVADCYCKRFFDLLFSILGLMILSPFLLIISLIIVLTSPGGIFFIQHRVGRYGKLFRLVKFRSMVPDAQYLPGGSVTVKNDKRITGIGRFIRRFKIDELPSLVNVMIGDMSFVGPRPDVPGYADKLKGEDRKVLKLRPGITGPATLKYSNEEELLAQVDDPQKYNDDVIFPDKVRLNREYLENWSFGKDVNMIWKTIFRDNY